MPCALPISMMMLRACFQRPCRLLSCLLCASTTTHLTAEAQDSSWTTTAVSTLRRGFGFLHANMQCCQWSLGRRQT